MRYEIDLGERPSLIYITLSSPVEQKVGFLGTDTSKKDTYYFARTKTVKGKTIIEFPMPIAPKILTIDLSVPEGKFGSYINVTDIKVKEFVNPKVVAFPKDTLEFYNFLKRFCEKAGYIKPGFYTSKDENFVIWAKPHLDDDGTPARVNRRTGVIKMNLSKIKDYTIPMRMFIGLHEYFHYAYQTTNEVKADMGALKVYLDAGFPKSEANYAMTKIFDNSKAAVQRVSVLHNYIKNYGNNNIS